MVSSLGTSGSNGNAFSLAIFTIIRRKAPDTVRPVGLSTAAASFLICSSMRARTTELAVMISLAGGISIKHMITVCALAGCDEQRRGPQDAGAVGEAAGNRVNIGLRVWSKACREL